MEAIRGACGALRDEQRLILRLHFKQGLTGEQIADTLRVHRATVVRWIRRAREDVLRETMRRLRESVHIAEAEQAGVFRALESQIDVTCSQLLG